MAYPISLPTYGVPSSDDADFYANNATITANTAITLLEDDTPDGYGHIITFTASQAVASTTTFTITGRLIDGGIISEVVTITAADATNPISTTQYYGSITSIIPNRTDPAVLDVGFLKAGATEIVCLDYQRGVFNTSIQYIPGTNGTFSVTPQVTDDFVQLIQSSGEIIVNPNTRWSSLTAVTQATTPLMTQITTPVVAIRFLVTAMEADNTLAINVLQQGIL